MSDQGVKCGISIGLLILYFFLNDDYHPGKNALRSDST